jgi:histone H3/H4
MSGRGKGGKGLGKGGAKHHRKVLRDDIQGITKPAIRRLARRGGVKYTITPAETEARKKKQATDSETPAETKARKNREKVARSRHKRKYEDQIKRIKEETGAMFPPVVTSIWSGDMKSGGWKEVTQLTDMANVSNSPASGCKPKPFDGAIVKLGDNYSAVPSSRFKIRTPCVARTGLHTTAHSGQTTWSTGDSAIRLTGVCHRTRFFENSTGYTYIEWCISGKREWLPYKSVEDTANLPRRISRRDKTDLYQYSKYKASLQSLTTFFPNDKKRERWYAFFKPAVEANETEEEGGDGEVCPIKAVMSRIRQNVSGIDPATAKPYHEGKVYDIYDLIQMSNARWQRDQVKEMFLNPWRNISQKDPPPDRQTMELSLTYDIFRGNILGSLGVAVDKSLKVVHDTTITNKMTYVDAINDIVQQRMVANLKMTKKLKGKGTHVVCSFEDCNSRVHGMFWRDKLCYSHGPKKDIMCKTCEKRHASRASGQCRACASKHRGQDGTKIHFDGWCYVCKVHKASSARRRCATCVAHEKFEKKNKKDEEK